MSAVSVMLNDSKNMLKAQIQWPGENAHTHYGRICARAGPPLFTRRGFLETQAWFNKGV